LHSPEGERGGWGAVRGCFGGRLRGPWAIALTALYRVVIARTVGASGECRFQWGVALGAVEGDDKRRSVRC